jgi:hypothetical protein
MPANAAIVALNKQNVGFWQAQKDLMERRMADPPLLETAIETISSEAERQVPIRSQISFEQALAVAERAKSRFLIQQARKGGNVKKADSLNELILEIVRRRPAMTAAELLERLRQQQYQNTIQDIDEHTIWFTTRDGRSKSAKISGLKDRLSRALRSLRSRQPARAN